MKRFSIIARTALLAILVTSCTPVVTPPPVEDGEMTSSSSSTGLRYATVEGVVQKAGVSIYMQGSHRLQMDDGTFLLLESSDLRLDDYVDTRVIVTGTVEPTVESGGMIMNVEMIEEATGMLEPEVLEESSFSSSSTSSAPSSAAAVTSSSATASSVVARSSSPASSPKPVPVVSSSSQAAVSSSATQTAPDASASVKAMAKAVVDAQNFNQKYCSSHIGFCIPYHRNWYFQSFGANVSPYLWHVEVSDQSVDEAGQGSIVVNLVSGSFEGTEGVAVEQGDFVVASRQWTGNRHIEISASKELRAAVEFMANGVEVYTNDQ
ncbi:MAG: hypothetical protein HOO67_03590 [Candidatus Peribacteraceae bacterium]|nr:hypothetical protein [Candidatus Peribacteraceae bacterium]